MRRIRAAQERIYWKMIDKIKYLCKNKLRWKMIQLYTERLIIRDHVLEDLTEHHELLSDEKSMRYLPDIQTKNLNESKENIIKSIEEANSEDRKLYFLEWKIEIQKNI
jgi:RimJ/RimL family protein N-acetyltransferase